MLQEKDRELTITELNQSDFIRGLAVCVRPVEVLTRIDEKRGGRIEQRFGSDPNRRRRWPPNVDPASSDPLLFPPFCQGV